jgi:hypothetical protein
MMLPASPINILLSGHSAGIEGEMYSEKTYSA